MLIRHLKSVNPSIHHYFYKNNHQKSREEKAERTKIATTKITEHPRSIQTLEQTYNWKFTKILVYESNTLSGLNLQL